MRRLLMIVPLALALTVVPAIAAGESSAACKVLVDKKVSSTPNVLDEEDGVIGLVFAATNSAAMPNGNEVLMYSQDNGGQLNLLGAFPTGGTGSGPGQVFRGDPLGSQNSLIVSSNERFLLVTNFLSDNVSVFRIKSDRLILTDIVPTGPFPVAIAESRGIVYVLSLEGGDGSIRGFRLTGNGRLNTLPNSVCALNAGAPNPLTDPTFVVFAPSDILFNPAADKLAVIIKGGPSFAPFNSGNGRIAVFDIRPNGRPASTIPVVTSTTGDLPFAGVFDDDSGRLIVVESFGGPPFNSADGTAAISSFDLNSDGTLSVITESLPLNALDSCWIVRVDDLLFTANFLSDNISAVRLQPNGSLELINTAAATVAPVSFNLDMIEVNGFLYNLLPGQGSIVGYDIVGSTGGLNLVGEFTDGLTATPDTEPAILGSSDGGSPTGMAALSFIE